MFELNCLANQNSLMVVSKLIGCLCLLCCCCLMFVRDLKSQVQRGTKKVHKKIIFITDLFLVRCSMNMQALKSHIRFKKMVEQ